MPIGVLTHQNSLVTKESYWKVFDRSEADFDMGTSMGSMPEVIFFFVSQFFLIEWCSHRTFDKIKILRLYPVKHHGQSVDKFLMIFNDSLER